MTTWKVYRITSENGEYIGVTSRSPALRLIELRCTRCIDGVVETLCEFDVREDALAHERKLRPEYNMGLNKSVGGHKVGGNLPMRGASNGMALRVRVCGIEYPTAQAAGAAHGLKKTTVNYRLQSLYYPDWEYIDAARGSYWIERQSKQRRKPAISAKSQARVA